MMLRVIYTVGVITQEKGGDNQFKIDIQYSSPSLRHGLTFADSRFHIFSKIVNFKITHVIGDGTR